MPQIEFKFLKLYVRWLFSSGCSQSFFHILHIPKVGTCERWVESNISILHEPSIGGLGKRNIKKKIQRKSYLGVFLIFQPVKHFQLLLLCISIAEPYYKRVLEIPTYYVRTSTMQIADTESRTFLSSFEMQ